MPTIERWHVARWIALFESQITRPPSFHLVLRGLVPLPSRLRLRPSSFSYTVPFSRHLCLRGGGEDLAEGEGEGKKSLRGWQRRRQFATCLRSCLLSPSERTLRQRQGRSTAEARSIDDPTRSRILLTVAHLSAVLQSRQIQIMARFNAVSGINCSG